MRESARGLVGVAVFWLLALGGVVGLALIIQHAPAIKPAHAQSTFLGPNATSVALSTTSAQVIGTNPARKMLQLCNTSTTIIDYIAPVPIVPVNTGGIGLTLPAVASGVTSCFTTPTGTTAGLGAAWNAVSASATPNIFILEYP